jgi:hypothetical protein
VGVWSEDFTGEYLTYRHDVDHDELSLNGGTTLHTAVFPDWLAFVRHWRNRFETLTGARPLWDNQTGWVRNIHAIYKGPNLTSDNYSQIKTFVSPSKLLYFAWNGSQIILFGDHTLAKSPQYITSSIISMVKQDGGRVLLYHPWSTIYSVQGTKLRMDRFNDPTNTMYVLPSGYTGFHPDYAGTADNWHYYWSDIGASISSYYNGVPEVLHPGAQKFKDYFATNFRNYCVTHNVDGAYLDTSGYDRTFIFRDSRRAIVEGQSYLTGQSKAFEQASQASPNFGFMTEYQAQELVPYSFYSWTGLDDHVKNTQYQYLINHPLRAALVSSYSWTMENNFSDRYSNDNDYYRNAALFGSLPEISFTSESVWPLGNAISKTKASFSQQKAKLFSHYDLFHDLPTWWDSKALAYFRSNTGNWFKFMPIGNTYAYVAELPSGEQKVHLTIDGSSPTLPPISPVNAGENLTITS